MNRNQRFTGFRLSRMLTLQASGASPDEAHAQASQEVARLEAAASSGAFASLSEADRTAVLKEAEALLRGGDKRPLDVIVEELAAKKASENAAISQQVAASRAAGEAFRAAQHRQAQRAATGERRAFDIQVERTRLMRENSWMSYGDAHHEACRLVAERARAAAPPPPPPSARPAYVGASRFPSAAPKVVHATVSRADYERIMRALGRTA